MTSINRPLEDAIKLARAANAKLAPVMAGDGELLAILTGDRLPTMRNLVERFEAQWLEDRDYAARPLVEIQFKLERYRQDLGDQLIDQLDVLTVAEYLDGLATTLTPSIAVCWFRFSSSRWPRAWLSATWPN